MQYRKKDRQRWWLWLIIGAWLLTMGGAYAADRYELLDTHDSNPSIEVQGEHGDLAVELSYTLTPQEATGRSWRDVQHHPIARMGGPTDSTIHRPRDIQPIDDRTFYVLDGGDYTVKRVTLDGQVQARMGEGRGREGSRFNRLSGVAVTDDGTVHVIDERNQTLVRFHADGEWMDRQSFGDIKPLQVAITSEDRLIVGGSPNLRTPYLHDFPPDSLEKRPFDSHWKPVNDATGNLMDINKVFDGRLVADADGGVFHTPRNAGKLLRFDRDGELDFARETMDRSGLPSLRSIEQNISGSREFSMQFNGESPLGNKVLSVEQDEVLVWSLSGTENREGIVIDVYDRHEGTYSYSFELELDRPVNRLWLQDQVLYTLGAHGELSTWRLSR